MDSYKIGGLAITGVFAILGIIKLELIKELVKKFTSDKEKINFISIILLIVIISIPAAIGFGIPNDNSANETTEIPQPKSKEEVKADLTKYLVGKGLEVAEKGKDYLEKRKEGRNKGDSVYNASKPQRWVYQIGDLMDNDESIILEQYKKLNCTLGICLFENDGKYFFFKNEEHTQKEIDDSLSTFKSQIGVSFTINKIDLMSFCNKSGEKIKQTKSQKFGRRKEKVLIDCFTVDN